MAIAEHHPDKVDSANRGVLSMSHQQLHDFAATPTHGLPQKVNAKPRPNKRYGGDPLEHTR